MTCICDGRYHQVGTAHHVSGCYKPITVFIYVLISHSVVLLMAIFHLLDRRVFGIKNYDVLFVTQFQLPKTSAMKTA